MKKYVFSLLSLFVISCSAPREVVQLYQGQKGDKGDPGTSCMVEIAEGGALLTCGEVSSFISNGTSGLNGVDGENGLSAYELWLEDGNEGTVSEFLESLIGPQGEDGSDGQNGSDGSDGASVVITSYTSSSCTAIPGTSFYVKSNGSTSGIYTSSTCHSSSKEFEMDEGDSMWLSSTHLAVKLVDTNGIRVVKF